MVIESTSLRTIIDLLESLRKNSFTASKIRVSYTLEGGKKQYVTFDSLDAIKDKYLKDYYKKALSKKNPFTDDPRLALQQPTSLTIGQLLYNTYDPFALYFESSTFFCKIGGLFTLESFEIKSDVKGYDMSFMVKDVTRNYMLIENKRFDLRRQDLIKEVVDRFRSSVQNFISIYNKIYARLSFLFTKGLYVELCYVTIGYVEFTFELYKLFFTINRSPIDTGIDINCLRKMYLRATP